MSSSQREIPPSNGVVVKDGQPIGPVYLPEERPDDFVDHFNRTYQDVGMKVEPTEQHQEKRNDAE